MAVERCNSCGRLVDLDTNVEGIIYLDTTPICDSCIDDTYYQEYIEKLENKIIALKQEIKKSGGANG